MGRDLHRIDVSRGRPVLPDLTATGRMIATAIISVLVADMRNRIPPHPH